MMHLRHDNIIIIACKHALYIESLKVLHNNFSLDTEEQFKSIYMYTLLQIAGFNPLPTIAMYVIMA